MAPKSLPDCEALFPSEWHKPRCLQNKGSSALGQQLAHHTGEGERSWTPAAETSVSARSDSWGSNPSSNSSPGNSNLPKLPCFL